MKLSNRIVIMAVSFLAPLCLTAQQNPSVPQNPSEPNAQVAPQNSAAPNVNAAPAPRSNPIPPDAYIVPMDGNFSGSCCAPQPTCCPPQPTCCAPQPTCCEPQNDYQPYYSNQQCCFEPYCCDNKFSFEVDYLYWQVRGLGAVGSQYKESGSTSLEGGYHSNAKCFVPKAHADSGVRLGLSYKDPCSCFKFGLIWTEIHSKWNRSLNGSDSNWIFEDGLAPFNSTALNNFKGSNTSKLNLDYLDFDISYDYELACCFKMTPHIGIRGLWLDGSFKNKIRGDVSVKALGNTKLKSHVHHNDEAAGIEGGLWLAWETRCHLTLFGHFGGSLLCYTNKGHFKNDTYTGDGGPNSNNKDRCKFESTSPMFNYSLGLQYTKCICNRNIDFNISWEQVHLDYQYLQWQGLTLGLVAGF